MRTVRPAMIAAVCAALFGGCGNVYEGIKANEEAKRTPAERATSPQPMTYEQYEAERRKLGK